MGGLGTFKELEIEEKRNAVSRFGAQTYKKIC